MDKTFGLIDISVDKGPTGYWYVGQTAHEVERPGDNNPVDWGEHTEHYDLKDAVESAERLAEIILQQKYARQVTIFVEGNEHKSY